MILLHELSTAAQAGRITTVVTILCAYAIWCAWRFGEVLEKAMRLNDEEEAHDEEELRMLARVAHSIDAMDEQKLHELEQWVG